MKRLVFLLAILLSAAQYKTDVTCQDECKALQQGWEYGAYMRIFTDNPRSARCHCCMKYSLVRMTPQERRLQDASTGYGCFWACKDRRMKSRFLEDKREGCDCCRYIHMCWNEEAVEPDLFP